MPNLPNSSSNTNTSTTEKTVSSIKNHRRVLAAPSIIQRVAFKKAEPSRSIEGYKQQEPPQQSQEALPARKIVIEKSMMQFITAKNFVIMCQVNESVVYSRKSHKPREVASLTKIMTCYTVICSIDQINKGLSYNTRFRYRS